MKVGFIVPGFSADAGDWCIPVLVDVVRELSRYVDVHVFTLRYPYRRARYQVHGVQVHALGGGQSRGARRVALMTAGCAAVVAESRRGRFDVLHGLWADEPGLLTVTAGRLLTIPTVVSVMGGELVALPDIAYGGRGVWSGRVSSAVALRAATRVTAGCTDEVELVQRSLTQQRWVRVVRLPWGIDPQVFESTAQVQLAGSFRVLHVGSLIPVKDQSTLLRAIARLRAREPGVHLHLVGEGPLRATLAEQAASLDLAGSVTFHGHVRRDKLSAFYRAADVLAVSSRHEAQCIAVLEAGLNGLPIAGTSVGLIADFAPHAAIAVPVGDDARLAEALAALLRPETRRALAGAARTLVRSKYLAPHTTECLRALYHQLE